MFDILFTKTPLVFFVQNVWRDEAFSYLMSQQSLLEILKTTAQDFNPPLYYLLLHYWMILFGNSEVALRSLSFVFFAGTIVLLFEIMLQVMKIPTRRALLYGILIAINPFLLSYAFEARMYMMVTFFVTLSYFALWTSRSKLYQCAILAALYTHYFAVFILAAQLLQKTAPGIIDSFKKKSFFTQFARKIPHFDMMAFMKTHLNFVLPIALFLPWIIYLLMNHNFTDGGFWIIRPLLSDILFLPFVLYTGYERIFGEYYHGRAGYTEFHSDLNIIMWVMILIPVFMTITEFLRRKRLIHLPFKLPISNLQSPISNLLWAFFTPISIFVISQLTTPLYHPRYYIVAVPGLILLLITSCEILYSLLSRSVKKSPGAARFIPYLLLLILVGFLMRETQVFNKLNLKYHSKQTVSRMYAEIMSVKQPEDQIYLTDDLDYPLALYYTGLDRVYIFNKAYDEIPAYVGKVLIPEDASIFQYPRFPAKAYIIKYDSYLIHSEL
ncbi:hypothetical protein KBD81_03090 [Candidatus Woesebacteria bacterium]|nr:hypothetical protein [Candidatus Woesebacteria bacterium]